MLTNVRDSLAEQLQSVVTQHEQLLKDHKVSHLCIVYCYSS